MIRTLFPLLAVVSVIVSLLPPAPPAASARETQPVESPWSDATALSPPGSMADVLPHWFRLSPVEGGDAPDAAAQTPTSARSAGDRRLQPASAILPAWFAGTGSDAGRRAAPVRPQNPVPVAQTLPTWFRSDGEGLSGGAPHYTVQYSGVTVSGPSEINNCDVVTFTIVVRNDVNTTTNVLLTSTMPGGFEPVERFHPLGTLTPGQVITLYDQFQATCSAVSGQHQATVSQDGQSAFTIYSDFLVNPGAITVRKTPRQTAAKAGDVVTWTLTVRNTGNGDAPNVVVTDTIGSGFSDSRVLTWAVRTLTATTGVWRTTVTATVQAGGAQTDTVSVSGSCAAGCTYAQASDTAYVTLQEGFDKGPAIQTATIGSVVVFTFAVSLQDIDAQFEQLALTDTLPTGLGYVASTVVYTVDADATPTTYVSSTPTVSPGFLRSGDVIWRLGDRPGAVQVRSAVF